MNPATITATDTIPPMDMILPRPAPPLNTAAEGLDTAAALFGATAASVGSTDPVVVVSASVEVAFAIAVDEVDMTVLEGVMMVLGAVASATVAVAL